MSYNFFELNRRFLSCVEPIQTLTFIFKKRTYLPETQVDMWVRYRERALEAKRT